MKPILMNCEVCHRRHSINHYNLRCKPLKPIMTHKTSKTTYVERLEIDDFYGTDVGNIIQQRLQRCEV